MELIVWNEFLITGIPIIDSQHKNLVNKINDLYNCIKAKESCEYLKVMLQSLVDYTYYHFETEERFFYKFDYPKKWEHLKEHEKFREELSIFMKNQKGDTYELGLEVLNFLNYWVIHHIKHIDMEYIEFLKDKIKNEN